jgi:hypothetical protein
MSRVSSGGTSSHTSSQSKLGRLRENTMGMDVGLGYEQYGTQKAAVEERCVLVVYVLVPVRIERIPTRSPGGSESGRGFDPRPRKSRHSARLDGPPNSSPEIAWPSIRVWVLRWHKSKSDCLTVTATDGRVGGLLWPRWEHSCGSVPATREPSHERKPDLRSFLC